MKPPTLKEQGYVPKRYIVALMSFLGMIFNYMLRVNINLAIVAMVKTDNSTNQTSDAADVCGFEDESGAGGNEEEGEFDWDPFTQSLITGSFFWGYVWTQIPGGRLGELIGAQRVLGVAMTSAAILSLLVPIAAHAGSTVLIIVRVLLGISEGATFPATHALISHWAPPLERSTLSTIIYAGSQAGTVVAYPLTAAIISGIGWEAVFYIQACMCLVWCVLWFIFVADNPSKDKRITNVEREYILASIGHAKSKKPPPLPLKSVLTSLPFYAILVANVGNNWGFYTLLTDLPLYMNKMLLQDINSNALLSGMPYLGMWMFSLFISVVSDKLMQAGYLSVGAVRKIATGIAHLGPATCLFALTFVECNREATIALLFTAVSLQGGIYTGYMVNHVDISPNFAGTLFGITNACGTIPGWLAPMTVGALTSKGGQTFETWNKVFYISTGIFVIDALFFILFSSGKVQSWNYVELEDKIRAATCDSKKLATLEPNKLNPNSKNNKKENMVNTEEGNNTLKSKAYEVYILDPNKRDYTNKAYTHED